MPFLALAQTADTTPPSAPTGLIATVRTCGQVDLSWNASTDTGGSGLRAYTINRSDFTISIGAVRTTFSDTNYLKSSSTLTYNVIAVDNAGNKSSPSNPVTVTTPACPIAAGEEVIDGAYIEPLGKNIATYGARTAIIYVKQNPLNLTNDTWLYVKDSDTGQASRFLLHGQPAYYQTETDYVLTSATELWTLSCDVSMGGNLLVSQYRLNGSPPTSATLISTKSLGDSKSKGKSMLRLRSGALVVAWNQEGWGYSAWDLTTGFAYRSTSGNWTVQFPVTIPNSGGGGIVMSQVNMAQHPADNSIWVFFKRDSFHDISALHFTESANSLVVDWVNPVYISQSADGDNGPEGEFPFLAAAADPSRNAILLAYQSYRDQSVFTDPVYGSMNSIFLKQAYATVAQIRADGTKTFIPFPAYMERCMQFGMSVLSDGTVWLAYQPINSETLTWNEVYARKYQNGVWGAPVRAGLNYKTYNVASGEREPGLLIHRVDQPQVAFMTPDAKLHSFTLLDSPTSSDTTAPSTSVTNPADGATVSGIVPVAASASDNVGVTRVDLLVDGVVQGSRTTAPYTFSWDARTAAGTRKLKTAAYDLAGNQGTSPEVTVSVSNPTDTTPPVTSISSPVNGATVAGTVAISASASDNVGVVKVEFLVDGAVQGVATAAPYTFSWNSAGVSNGVHALQTAAYDSAGNKGTSAAVSVTVSNSGPVVSITSPADGAAVQRNTTVVISATASDAAGVRKVDFYIDNKPAGTSTAAPYGYSWKVPAKRNGSYTIKAVATNVAGVSASATIAVTAR